MSTRYPWGVEDNSSVYEESGATIQQVRMRKVFSENHELFVQVLKTSLGPSCEHISSKTLPLIVRMIERDGEKRFFDMYSIDNNGVCLSHGYSRYENGKASTEEEHDTDTSRLKKHGKTIKEMILKVPRGSAIAMDGGFGRLIFNEF